MRIERGGNLFYAPDEAQATPLFDELRRHAQRNPVQFHIPGHKRGTGMDVEFRAFIGDNALAIDQINIAPLDDSHQPHGIIAEAQRLAAAAFGAEQTFFSVQGTSTAIMAMIMATCGPGDKIIVPRNVHKSVMSSLILSGATPVYIVPELDPDTGFVGNVSVETVQRALAEHPDARALLMINPSYYGAVADLRTIVQLAHHRDVPVLVDEAHGAQFSFHSDLPASAMEAGADAAAVSMHKTGGSLTQSSMLHVQGSRIDPRRVQTILNLLTTTSTSYLLLASLDTSRRYMQHNGRRLLERALAVARDVREAVNSIDGLHCYGADGPGSDLAYKWDATKLCINVRDLGLSGIEVEDMLRNDYNIEVELSDLHNILCLITIADDGSAGRALVEALQSIADAHKHILQDTGQRIRPRQADTFSQPAAFTQRPPVHTPVLTPREAFYATTESLPFEETPGRITAEFVTTYPPGIPTLVPGEVVTEADVETIRRYQALGYPVHGPEDATVRNVRVVRM